MLEGSLMKEVEVRETRALFVVVLPEILVGRDIEMIIRDACPDAQVLVTPNLRDAEKALPEGRIRAVFVQSEAAAILASSFGQRVANDRGLVVLVGQEELPELPEGWKALPFPFAGRDVAKLLSGVALAAASPL
jgi:ABC-type amino acid transport substrate-binding protein